MSIFNHRSKIGDNVMLVPYNSGKVFLILETLSYEPSHLQDDNIVGK